MASLTTVIRFTSAKPLAALGNIRKLSSFVAGGTGHVLSNELAQILERFAGGLEAGTLDVQLGTTAAVRASGTLTISGGTGTVGASSIGGNAKTVTWATSDTATAAALATAINADTTINKYAYATSAAGVVTIKAMSPGTWGNTIALVATGTGVSASGATLTGGAGDDVIPLTFSRL